MHCVMWCSKCLHAFTEAGESAGLLLVAALSEPALDGPHVPVELLGQALQPLLVRVLARQGERSVCKDVGTNVVR